MGKIFFEGFALQASLIFALGAQNLFVLEAGLQKKHHIAVSLMCFFCDLCLILLGVAGAASVFTFFPSLRVIIGVVGVGFLFFYGVERMGATQENLTSTKVANGLKSSLILAMTFSLLNPHAYLDAFVLIGGYSSKYSELNDRITLGLGAAIYSGLWFVILSSLSGMLKPMLTSQKRMKYISVCAGLVLIIMSVKLAIDVAGWIPESVREVPIAYGAPVKLFTTVIL